MLRHFKLYKYVFTPRIVMDLNFQYPNQPEPVEEENQGMYWFLTTMVYFGDPLPVFPSK